MPIDYQSFLELHDDERSFAYSDRETMLYALGVGMGRDPLNASELPFVFEGAGLIAMPTIAAVLTRSNLPRTLPINMALMLHGEQGLVIHRQIPPSGTLLASTRITAAVDKGEGKGALIYYETTARLVDEDAPLYTVRATLFARGDGGFGGPTGPVPAVHPIPDRDPDIVHETETRPDQALLYRLSGDRNPLHADPAMGKRAGFPVPILHGLCTYAIACRAVLATVCDYDVARIQTFDVRFSSPVFPGDQIVTEIWVDANEISFRCRVPARDVTVVNNGRCQVGPAFNEQAA